MYKGLLNQYASYLPVNENTPDVSLMEGNTPYSVIKYIKTIRDSVIW